MSKQAFPYPLPEYALREFCHPAEWHDFHEPRRFDGEMLAGNGYVAIRAHRGAWLDAEHEAARADFVARFGKLPWGRWESLGDDWRALDDVRAALFRSAPVGLWLGDRLAPSPVWRVAGRINVRLSLLQLVARLPRCEVYAGDADREDPLWFRFSGGRGAIAFDAKLTVPRFEIFRPGECPISGERIQRAKVPAPRLVQPGVNWPPVDLTDAEGQGETRFVD